jgi:hypothetical protein
MFSFWESAFRARLDPHGALPPLTLSRPSPIDLSSSSVYEVRHNSSRIGSTMLKRMPAHIGEGTVQVMMLDVHPRHNADTCKRAATVAILAMSFLEGRALVTDPNGLSREETDHWYWLANNQLATITEPFVPVGQLASGQDVYSGSAVASPILHGQIRRNI